MTSYGCDGIFNVGIKRDTNTYTHTYERYNAAAAKQLQMVQDYFKVGSASVFNILANVRLLIFHQ